MNRRYVSEVKCWCKAGPLATCCSLPFEGNCHKIGMLDLSGFEVFENNKFEQLCINFANELVQQLFMDSVVQREQVGSASLGEFRSGSLFVIQEIYALEGLRWKEVTFDAHNTTIELIANKENGIFTLLNEECRVPKATSRTFALKVHTTHEQHDDITYPRGGMTRDEGMCARVA